MKTSETNLGAPFLAVVGVLLAGIAFAVVYQIGRPLWMDDTHSTHHAFNGPLSVIENLRTDSHPPLYFLFLSLWIPLVGLGEVVLRLPSILFFLTTGLVLFLFGRRVEGEKGGVLMAAFFLLNPIAVYHAQGVRPYALLGLLAAISTVLFLKLADAEREGGRGVVLAFTLSNVLGTFTHYWFFFLLTGQGIGALLFSRGKARLRLVLSLFASAVPFAGLWTPFLLEQLKGTPTTWMEVPGGFWLLSMPLELLGGWEYGTAIKIFLVLFGLTCILRLGDGRLGFLRIEAVVRFVADRNVRLTLLLPVVVMVLAFFLSQISPVYHVRYTIVAIPALAILLALTLMRLGEERLIPPLALTFILGSCFLRTGFLAAEMKQDDRATTEYLVEHYQEGDEIVHVTLNYAPVTHYLRALAPGRSFSRTVFPPQVADHVGWRDVEGMTEDQASLRMKAEEIARSLSLRPGLNHVWLLAALPARGMGWLQPDSIFTGLLVEALRQYFWLEDTVPIKGWWHREIQVYAPRPGVARPTLGSLEDEVQESAEDAPDRGQVPPPRFPGRDPDGQVGGTEEVETQSLDRVPVPT